ncbi:MAG: transposase [Candidatus Levyibacteriota bacterium]|nr:MAG: transposase [Candidatus Levybacteria bacterium]
MPGRKTPLVNNEIYHIFNRGVASQPTFLNKRDYDRALETIFYYQNSIPPIKYSRFLSLSTEDRTELFENLAKQKNFLVEIISYCLMPNHFHFLLRQIKDGGIAKFISNFTNSYTRFFNTKRERTGPLFTGKFKSVRIETQEQLLHVSRYIHLNPYTSFVAKTLKDLETYPYSSFPEFINKVKSNFCTKDIVLANYKNIESYKQFVFDQADYQRSLGLIKHLTTEN